MGLTRWCRAGRAWRPGCNKDPRRVRRLQGDSRGAATAVWTERWRHCETDRPGVRPVPATPHPRPLQNTERRARDAAETETRLGKRGRKTHPSLSINQCIHELPWDSTYQRTAALSWGRCSLLDTWGNKKWHRMHIAKKIHTHICFNFYRFSNLQSGFALGVQRSYQTLVHVGSELSAPW